MRRNVIENGSRGTDSDTVSLRLTVDVLPSGVVTVCTAITGTCAPQRGSGAVSNVVLVPSASTFSVMPSTRTVTFVLAPVGVSIVRTRSPESSTCIEYRVCLPPPVVTVTRVPPSIASRVSVRSSPSAPWWAIRRPVGS